MSAEAAETAGAENKEWETEGGAEPAAAGETAERMLNQDEIDSLLGFGLGEED
jgi:hypothetical protein